MSAPSRRTRSAHRSLCLCLLLGFAASPGRGTEKDGDWIEVKSPNFTVVSNGGERSAVDAAKRFEQIRAVFAMLLPDVPGRPITILGAEDEATMKTLAPQYWDRKGGVRPGAVWWPTYERDYVLLRMDERGDDYDRRSTAYWGLASQMVSRAYPRVPLWVTRGLTQFYGYTSVQKDQALIGRASAEYIGRLRENIRIPLERLFAVDRTSREYLQESELPHLDAESWALTHFFVVGNKGANRERFQQYINAASREGTDPVAVAREAFGDLRQLDTALRNYVSQQAYYTLALPAALQVTAKEFTSRKLAIAESRAVLETFHADTEGRDRVSGSDDTPGTPPAGNDLRTTKSAMDRPCDEGRWNECEALADALMAAGKGLEERAVAAAMLSKACDAKRDEACLRLAVWHDKGEYLPKDDARSLDFFEKACGAGKAAACIMAGYRREIGQPAPADAGKALALYETACNAGELDACGRAGNLLREGEGLIKDDARATALLEKACTAGQQHSCLALGFVLINSDANRAASLFKASCDSGQAEACSMLGSLHLYGQGVAKDRTAARAFFKKACDGGYKDACDHLGRMKP